MTHPFANGINYPWARPETKRLYEVLVANVTDVPRIDLLFKESIPEPAPLNLQQAPGALWKDVLEQIALAGALLRLCDLLAEMRNHPQLREAAQAVLEAKPAVQKRIGRDGRVIADRAPLRQQLMRLALEEAPVKVILVRGEAQTGKTWSRHLFERAARDRGADVTYIFNGTAGSVKNLIHKLFSTLQASDRIPPPDDTTRDAWYQQVCDRLAEEASRRGRPLWIAVDDLGPGPDGITPLMDTEIRSFFDHLAMNLVDPAVHPWFRLMLIHYPGGEVPTKWDQELWEEDCTHSEDVRADDVADVVREWAADHDQQIPDAEIADLADRIISGADGPAPASIAGFPRLRRINDGLKSALDGLGGRSL